MRGCAVSIDATNGPSIPETRRRMMSAISYSVRLGMAGSVASDMVQTYIDLLNNKTKIVNLDGPSFCNTEKWRWTGSA